jgi:hypothetical protein
MRRRLALFVLAVTVVIGACGSDGAGSASSYCKALKDVAASVRSTTTAKGPNTTLSPNAALAQADEKLAVLQKAAPSELKDHYKALRDYYAEYVKVLGNPNADKTKLTAIQPKADAAGKAISTYNNKHCGTATSVPAGSSGTTASTAAK